MDPPNKGNPSNDPNKGSKEDLLINLGPTSNVPLETPSSSSSTSSSSSSSSSDDGDFIQLAPTNLENPTTLKGSEGIAGNTTSPLVSVHDVDLTSNFGFHGHSVDEGAPSDSQDATFGTKQSPPTQMMVRNDPSPPDPYRIPSSVFERTKSTAPMEWSVASNESLFSIHMGNNSFSGDHAILLDMAVENPSLPLLDLRKDPTQPITTGTAGKSSEEIITKSPDVPLPIPLPPLPKQSNVGNENSTHPGTSRSYHSDGSPTSMNSFAFPILTEGQAISLKVDNEKQTQEAAETDQQLVVQEELEKQGSLPSPPVAPPPPTWKAWCSCFSCFPCCS